MFHQDFMLQDEFGSISYEFDFLEGMTSYVDTTSTYSLINLDPTLNSNSYPNNQSNNLITRDSIEENNHLQDLFVSKKRSFEQIQSLDSFDTNDYETKLFKQSLYPISSKTNDLPIKTNEKDNQINKYLMLQTLPKELYEEKEQTLQEIRLNTFNIFLDIFNLDDDLKLYHTIHRHSSSNLQFKLTHNSIQSIGYSANLFFAMFYFTREIYPDGMFKLLERRIISSQNTSKSDLMPVNPSLKPTSGTSTTKLTTSNTVNPSLPTQTPSLSAAQSTSSTTNTTMTVEYIYKFTGTRITKFLMFDLLHDLLLQGPYELSNLANIESYEELTCNLVHRVTNNTLPSTNIVHQTNDCDNNPIVSSMICSALFTFDLQTNLIEQIEIELLAYN